MANIGTGSTNALGWTDHVYLSLDSVLDGNDFQLGSVQNGSYLNPADSYLSTLTATLPQGIENNYRIIVLTDASNSVAEPGAENNNVRVSSAIVVSLTPPPDLFVSSLLTAPAQVLAGDSIEVNWTVVNQGTGPTVAANWIDQVYISFNGNQLDPTDTLLAFFFHTGALDPGASYSVNDIEVTLPAGMSSGDAYIIVRTDAGNHVFEHVFENNNRTARFQGVAALPPPDLAVTSITAPQNIAAGQALTVGYVVKNEGPTATIISNWSDTIYLSPTPTLDLATAIVLGTRTRNGALDTNQSEARAYTFTLTNTLTGSYYVIVSADSGNQVTEAGEVNNIVATNSPTVISFAPPDLIVSQVVISQSLLSGQDVTFTYFVTNQGASPTPINTWFDGIYLSTNSTVEASDLLLAQPQRTGVLAPGQTQTRSMSVRLPVDRFGSFFVIVVADNTHGLFELAK